MQNRRARNNGYSNPSLNHYLPLVNVRAPFNKKKHSGTVDGSEPPGMYLKPVNMGYLPYQLENTHYLQGFVHSRWLFGISEPSICSKQNVDWQVARHGHAWPKASYAHQIR